MKLSLAHITHRKSAPKSEPSELLTQQFAQRCTQYSPLELLAMPTEAALLAATDRQPGRPAASLILFDSRGDLATSESFASYIGKLRDTGAQRILFAIGPADGWSPAALARAARSFSFGRITLPHELARTIAAEQIYRALTILAGHPYHSGH